jgi:hypothetical protein
MTRRPARVAKPKGPSTGPSAVLARIGGEALIDAWSISPSQSIDAAAKIDAALSTVGSARSPRFQVKDQREGTETLPGGNKPLPYYM